MNNLGTLHDLAVFVAVAETEGFSAAAKRLSASKAMVSVAVGRLEADLGVRLFQRTTRRLSLTEAGQAALPHAQRALLAARDAEESATQALLAPRGVLRVNAPMSFGLLHVVPALGAFARAHSEVRVDLVLEDRVLDLVEGGFDLALRVGTLADSSLIVHRLAAGSNVIAAHPSYLERAGTPTRPSELSEHAALVYSLSPTGARWTFTRGSKTETIAVRGPLRVNNSLALHQALLQGLGLARIPRFVVGEDLANGRLVQVLPEWQLPDYGVFALTAERELMPRKTRAFIDFFRARLGDPPYWESAVPPGEQPTRARHKSRLRRAPR